MIKLNIIFNLLGKSWALISTFVFIPLYVHILGIEMYGIIGFYTTLLVILAFADLGLTATLTREVSRNYSHQKGGNTYLMDLLKTYELLYLFISITISFIIYIVAPLIVNRWLHLSSNMNPENVILAVRYLGFAIAFQLPANLFYGGLMGLEKQVSANILQILWGILRNLSAVFVLYYFSVSIVNFAICQFFSNLLYCLIIRSYLWISINPDRVKAAFKKNVLLSTWRYSTGMAMMSLISITLGQADKLIVSKLLPLKEFSYYSLASTVSIVPMIVAEIFGMAIFPRFARFVKENDINNLSKLFLKGGYLLSLSVLTISISLMFFSRNFLFAWTGSSVVAAKAQNVVILLLIGQTLQALALMPYYLGLAHGYVRINLQMGVISILILLPCLFLTINKFGLIGGGISWALTNLLVTTCLVIKIVKRFLSSILLRWILQCILLPLISITICLWALKLITPINLMFSQWRIFVCIGISATTTLLVVFFILEYIFKIVNKKLI